MFLGDPAKKPLLKNKISPSYDKADVDLKSHETPQVAEQRPVPAKTKPEEEINVFINNKEKNEEQNFPDNIISTARYNVITFLPLNLFTQFRRLANIYFLIVVAVQFIPDVSPFSVYISIMPLAFILTVTAIKDGVEDYYRHKEDKRNNSLRVWRLSESGEFVSDVARNVVVGDILKIYRNCEVSADCICIGSSNSDGSAYINTASLDGENAPKARRSGSQINKLNASELSELQGRIICAPNTKSLDDFVGTMIFTSLRNPIETEINLEDPIPLDVSNFYYRGSYVSNVDYIHAFVLFSGTETTMMLNRKPQPFKFSTFEQVINHTVLGLILVNFMIVFILTLTGYFTDVPNSYIDPYGDLDLDSTETAFINFWVWYVIFSFMIPISLYVTVEFVKLAQAQFINWDNQMMILAEQSEDQDEVVLEEWEEQEEKNVWNHARVKNSALNEELGMVKFIFTDKTGTLTQNKMELSKCCIRGTRYRNDILDTHQTEDDLLLSELAQDAIENKTKDPHILHFFQSLLANNATIITDNKKDERGFPLLFSYGSPSPDEVAFSQGLSGLGMAFVQRRTSPETIVVSFEGDESDEIIQHEYIIRGTLEFQSSRARMTVIVEDEKERIFLYTKGADNVIERFCIPDETTEETQKHVKDFAIEGCRTLMFAYRELSREEYLDFKEKQDYVFAHVLHNRDAELENVFVQFEKDLILLGATAVNDQLQNGVPWAIQKLKEAGIVITVLTGDKEETAITIAKEANILGQDFKIVRLPQSEDEPDIETQLVQLTNLDKGQGNLGLVISGNALEEAIKVEGFYDLLETLSAIVCFRANPSQKAVVVNGAKELLEPVSLAIGDGANDVSMIQEAHVGVGIQGREGSQAALSADFVIYRFRHLVRLILTHGRYSYLRTSKTVILSFYKNITFIMPCAYFAAYSLVSTQNLYEGFIMSCFNIFFTSLTPLAVGFFEEDIPQEATVNHPLAYKQFARNPMFTLKYFLGWIGLGIFHSLFLFFIPYAIESENRGVSYENGREGGMWVFGNLIYFAAVCCTNIVMLLACSKWSWPLIIAVCIGPLAWLVICGLYQLVLMESNYAFYGSITLALQDPMMYLALPIILFLLLFPLVLLQYYQRNFNADLSAVLLEMYSKFPAIGGTTKELVDIYLSEDADTAIQMKQKNEKNDNLWRQSTHFA